MRPVKPVIEFAPPPPLARAQRWELHRVPGGPTPGAVLAAWGAAGFELVAVSAISARAGDEIYFFKRPVPE